MARGKPLKDAPGWRVIERQQRRSWRAGYVIVPLAVIVAVFQLFIPSDSHHADRSEDRAGQVSDASSTEAPSAAAPQGEQSAPADIGRSADAKRPPSVAGGAGATGEATAPLGPPSIRVFIHHAAGARNALPAIQLAAFLQTRGFAVTNLRPVDVAIERPSVRYFFEGDRPETRRLVDAIGVFFASAPGRAPGQATDFSHYAPKPPQGNVEVWLPPPRESGSA